MIQWTYYPEKWILYLCFSDIEFTILIYFANKGLSSESYGFSSSHAWMWEVDHKESWALKNCFWIVVLEKTLESPLDCKEVKPVSPKGNKSWIFIGRTDAEAETIIFRPRTDWLELTHWKRSWCWGRLKAGGEGDDRGWDGWMASPTQWTWIWGSPWSWWWTGKPGMLQSMGSQRVRHDWVTELNWSSFKKIYYDPFPLAIIYNSSRCFMDMLHFFFQSWSQFLHLLISELD